MRKHQSQWVFGSGAGLDFSTDPPTPRSGFAMNQQEGCASIADDDGALLFYTDGTTIWKADHTALPVTLLGGVSSTQSVTIVPVPGSHGERFYVLTIDGSSAHLPPINHFNGGVLDVTTWAWTPLANLPSTAGYSPAEKLISVRHANCEDTWIVTVIQEGTDLGLADPVGPTEPVVRDDAMRSVATTSTLGPPLGPFDQYTNDGPGWFRVYRVTVAGLHHWADTPMHVTVWDGGHLKASPDGSRLAVANAHAGLQIYRFDNATGVISTAPSDTIHVPNAPGMVPYGVEFSASGRVLYYGATAGQIRQLDLTSIAPPTALPGAVVATVPTAVHPNYAIGALQRGPDDRIYIAQYQAAAVGVIDSPETLGTGCNVIPSYRTLPAGAISQLGLPNLPHDLGEGCKTCDCDCETCHEGAARDNAELVERARAKAHTVVAGRRCGKPFAKACKRTALPAETSIEPCFYFHWGDGPADQIEEHDTELIYLTVCNPFRDVTFQGFRITRVRLVPAVTPSTKIQLVPDRFIELGCLAPCACQTRELALITRGTDIAGAYTLEIDYCYDELVLGHGGRGTVRMPLQITEDEP